MLVDKRIFEDQSQKQIALGMNSYDQENENNVFEDNLILNNNCFQNYLENQNNSYSV